MENQEQKDGQKSKWKFVETLRYMKGDTSISIRFTNYRVLEMQPCLNLLREKLVTNLAIRATKGFNLQRNIVARQVEGRCCSYYRTLKELFYGLNILKDKPKFN